MAVVLQHQISVQVPLLQVQKFALLCEKSTATSLNITACFKNKAMCYLMKFIIYLYFTKPQIWWGMTSWFLEGSAPIKRLSTRFADQFTEWVYKDVKRREQSGVRLWTVSPTTVGMEKLRTRLLERNYGNPGKKKTPVTSVMTQDYMHCSVLLFSFFSLQLYSLFP